MLLATQFFSINDVVLVPFCILLLFAILRNRAQTKPPEIRRLYYNLFVFKIICVFAFAFISEFYFGGGDTLLYYKGIKDLRQALSEDPDLFWTIITSPKLSLDNPLAPYFLYDNYVIDMTYNYMESASNFFVPRLGLIPSMIFYNSYLCISLCFSFFALGGAIRLFKFFYYYYPKARREIALSVLFLPSVSFWSAGVLKDTITFGCVGFILYALLNIFIRKIKIRPSIFWIILCGYLLFVIKTYIFLILILAVVIWLFAETNKLIKEKTLRRIFAFLTFVIGFVIGFFLLQYFTSQESLRQYQIDSFITQAEYQRSNYEMVDRMFDQNTSYYSINTSNPFLLVINSIGAVFFRPFLWEVNSAAAILSAVEAFAFMLLTLHVFYKTGFFAPFRIIFSDPRIMMSFIFALIFAVGVGASTANFGALSRYKIPCIPFYLIILFLIYLKAKLPYPRFLSKILKLIK